MITPCGILYKFCDNHNCWLDRYIKPTTDNNIKIIKCPGDVLLYNIWAQGRQYLRSTSAFDHEAGVGSFPEMILFESRILLSEITNFQSTREYLCTELI